MQLIGGWTNRYASRDSNFLRKQSACLDLLISWKETASLIKAIWSQALPRGFVFFVFGIVFTLIVQCVTQYTPKYIHALYVYYLPCYAYLLFIQNKVKGFIETQTFSRIACVTYFHLLWARSNFLPWRYPFISFYRRCLICCYGLNSK